MDEGITQDCSSDSITIEYGTYDGSDFVVSPSWKLVDNTTGTGVTEWKAGINETVWNGCIDNNACYAFEVDGASKWGYTIFV